MIITLGIGIIIGLLFGLIAVIAGKKGERAFNDPQHTIKPLVNAFKAPQQAQIIKRGDSIDEFLNEN